MAKGALLGRGRRPDSPQMGSWLCCGKGRPGGTGCLPGAADAMGICWTAC